MKNWIDLTDRFPLRFDVNRMLEEIKTIEGREWLSHYDSKLAKGWTAIPLISLDGKLGNSEAQRPGDFSQYKATALFDLLPYTKQVINFFQCPKGRVRLMKLAAGGRVGAHRDVELEVANYAFKQVRLHVPLCTNNQVFFYVGRDKIHMEEGHIYYANFSKVHSVVNEGSTDRIHMMLDLKVNDWLAQFFPKLAWHEHIEHAVARTALPMFWKARNAEYWMKKKFWRAYEGSRLQSTYQRLRRRTRGARPHANVEALVSAD